ncbi:hypothetical protein FZEAL_3096 [Fusarium zealandicum]|uniref:Aminoglycoside phosphotransferase domain-containing protein n=1 Tax=Fusarium zealandicum TaxID=1053134 RepID=A0A8H4XMT8_9HYPO|nr:hypothetical protein FZEAL_3096 [Fusarium zealandicum]
MDTTQETPEETRLKVLAWLNTTRYASTSLKPLVGGQANFIYHAQLAIPLEDGMTQVVIKQGEPYMAKHPTNAITTDRCHVEAECLAELSLMQVHTNEPGIAKYVVRTPKNLDYHDPTKTQVQEYLPGMVDLKSYCLEYFSSPTHESLQPQCHQIGKALAKYIAHFHDTTKRTLQDPASQNNSGPLLKLDTILNSSMEMQALKHTINYDWLLQRVEQFPEILAKARNVFEQVKAMASDEISSESRELTIIHGDFCPQNVLVRDAPLEADKEIPLVVVDWENAQLGVASLDHGEMIGEIYALWLYKRIDAALWILQGYIEGLGLRSESFIWRLAIQVGVHLLSFRTTAPGWGTPAQIEDVARKGRDIIINAWRKDRPWFDGNELTCLFDSTRS